MSVKTSSIGSVGANPKNYLNLLENCEIKETLGTPGSMTGNLA